ncbi:MAG: DMT family transporter [Bacteriovoracaceae bacterium]|nr:DMT family transporter [Bacteriovoracaceae bacterium]
MSFSNQYIGDVASVTTALSWSIAVILFQSIGYKYRVLAFNLFKNTAAIVFFGVTLVVLGETSIPNMSARDWGIITFSGVLGVALGDILFISSLNKIGASMQAIVDCLYSPMVLVMAYFLFSEVLSPIDLLGGFLVLSGIFVVGFERGGEGSAKSAKFVGIVFGVLSQFFTILAVLISRDVFQKEYSLVWLTFYRFFFGNITLIIYILVSRQKGHFKEAFELFKTFDLRAWASSFFGPFLATILWFTGFKYTMAGKAAIYNQLSTVFIILLSTWFLKEKLSFRKVLAVALGITGAVLVSWN